MTTEQNAVHAQLAADFDRAMDAARGFDATPTVVDHDATVPTINVPMSEMVYGPADWDGTNGVDDRSDKR